jgi:hypothetical protein
LQDQLGFVIVVVTDRVTGGVQSHRQTVSTAPNAPVNPG